MKSELAKAGFHQIKTVTKDLIKGVKPRPREMDEWTHVEYDASGNPVSGDMLVEPPTGVRWIAGPRWPRAGRKGNTIAVLSAKGKMFYLTKSAFPNMTAEPDAGRWFIMARDAFNGLLLWKRPLSLSFSRIKPRIYYREHRPFAAAEHWVFTGEKNDVVILKASNGEILHQYKTDSAVDTVQYSKGSLVATSDKAVYCLDPAEGTLKWKYDAIPIGLRIDENRIFFLDTGKKPYDLVSLELESGKQVWRKSTKPLLPQKLSGKSDISPLRITLCKGKVIVISSDESFQGVSAHNGEPLWKYENASRGHYSNIRQILFYHKGSIWVPATTLVKEGREKAITDWVGLDPETGKEKGRIKGPKERSCGRFAATKKYLISLKYIKLFDWETGTENGFFGGRGPCRISLVPANGLLYSPTVTCGCLGHSIRGYIGLASDPRAEKAQTAGHLEKGPAFGTGNGERGARNEDWPMHRHDPQRSGNASTVLPENLQPVWQAEIASKPAGLLGEEWLSSSAMGDIITAPVIAKGLVLCVSRETHQVVALDDRTGSTKWTFTADGRIDSPPTYYKGLCLFGSKAGWVYCLKAEDGSLVWRLRAAPLDRRVMVCGQLESVWPVPGTVLVDKDIAFFTAGRSVASDGGVFIVAVKPGTGELIWKKQILKDLYGDARSVGQGYTMLVGDGKRVCLNTAFFDYEKGAVRPDGKATMLYYKTPHRILRGQQLGLLNGEWRRHASTFRTTSWSYGPLTQRWNLLIVFNSKRVFGFRASKLNGQRGDMRITKSELVALDAQSKMVEPAWSVNIKPPFQIEAMILAGNTLIAAGPLNGANPKDTVVRMLSAENGKKLNEIKLDTPTVFDGMAAANGRLYIATQDGKVLCFGKK
jgi:outer membrane protein assembly factor BamB